GGRGGLRGLDPPAVVRTRAFGFTDAEHERRPYVVAEHFDAPTLAEHVARHGPLPPDEWLEIVWPIARALQALHNRGVLHRGLRPGAVLLRQEPTDHRPRLRGN